MNYIGSKYSLLSEIDQLLSDQSVPANGTAVDVFAGTGSVAQYLKLRGHSVIANDWQSYAYHTNVALVKLDEVPHFDRLFDNPQWRASIDDTRSQGVRGFSLNRRDSSIVASSGSRVLSYLDAKEGTLGRFFDEYCDGGKAGRKYFSDSNGRRIQAIRDQIEEWYAASLLSEDEKSWLIACLVESADRVANTASVYGAYLKGLKTSASKPLRMIALLPERSQTGCSHEITCVDSEDLIGKLRDRCVLAYIDPPYNARQYSANYHVLETIARWDLDSFEPRGRTGLRPSAWQRSSYCSRRHAYSGFSELLENMPAANVLFSYNNEGIVSEEEFRQIFTDHFAEFEFRRISFRRFRADVDSESRAYKADSTSEFLILGKRESVSSFVSLPVQASQNGAHGPESLTGVRPLPPRTIQVPVCDAPNQLPLPVIAA